MGFEMRRLYDDQPPLGFVDDFEATPKKGLCSGVGRMQGWDAGSILRIGSSAGKGGLGFSMIKIRNLSRRYSASFLALEGVDLDVAEKEMVAVTGPSGCGKSTLLHLLGGLDRPSGGEIEVGGRALHLAGEAELTAYRRSTVGMVFQFFHLLPTMSVQENVCVPLLLQGVPVREAHQRAAQWLEWVGLVDRAGHRVHELSGGQMQRTAIARALVHEPRLVLADEPTGNLDSRQAGQVMELLQRITSKLSATMVVVTHSADVARAATREVQMCDGRIVRG